MKTKAILAALALLAAGAAGIIAATNLASKAEVSPPATNEAKQTAVVVTPADEASVPVAGSVVFIDASGNKIQPTAEQIKALRAATKSSPRTGGAPVEVPIDPNDPSKGVMLTNIPPVAAAARINPDGTVEAVCFDNEAEATKFINGEKAAAHSHDAEVAK